jgi:hypothetical protein
MHLCILFVPDTLHAHSMFSYAHFPRPYICVHDALRQGLRKSWQHGLIYCSPTTAKLVETELNVEPKVQSSASQAVRRTTHYETQTPTFFDKVIAAHAYLCFTCACVCVCVCCVYQWILPRPLNKPFLVGSATVTFVRANHCPGHLPTTNGLPFSSLLTRIQHESTTNPQRIQRKLIQNPTEFSGVCPSRQHTDMHVYTQTHMPTIHSPTSTYS